MEARQLLSENAVQTISDKGWMGYLTERWSKLLKGVEGKHRRKVTATLYENQYRHLKRLSEDTRTQNVGEFTKYIFPLLRKVVPNLIAHEIVSVQPMSAPVGAVFFHEWRYATNKGNVTAGTEVYDNFEESYSSNRVVGEHIGTGDGVNYGPVAGNPLSVDLMFYPVYPKDSDKGWQVYVREYDASGNIVQEATDDGSGSLNNDDGSSGTISYPNGKIVNFRFDAIPANAGLIKVDYEYNMEMNQNLPEVSLDISMEPIVARPRKIKARWSPEASEDLRAFHGEEAETDIISNMSQQMQLEIDREILNDLLAFSSQGTTTTYDRAVQANEVDIDAVRRILVAVNDVAEEIHRLTRRAPANWIVTSTKIQAIFQLLATHGDFLVNLASQPVLGAPVDAIVRPPSYGTTTSDFGIMRVGVLANRFNVYVDPYFNQNQLLMGFKGQNYLDAGYVWAPYVPLVMTPTFLDPADMSFKKGVRSRYAKKRLRSGFYGRVTVSNLTI